VKSREREINKLPYPLPITLRAKQAKQGA